MAVEENLTTDVFVKAQSIDLVEMYGKKIQSLFDMLGVHRKYSMPIGGYVQTYKSEVDLKDGKKVEPGDVIPLSKVSIKEGPKYELEWSKHRKAVPAEDIQTYGFDQAIALTDEKLLRELQRELRNDLFAHLEKGTGEAEGADLQAAVAQGWGNVQTVFEDDAAQTIVFINPLDAADYLAGAEISIQTAFGMQYVENFMNTQVAVFSPQVEKGTIYATEADNLCFAYAQVNGGELGKAFDFTTDDTGVIGVMKDVNAQRLTAETITLSAVTLYAERLDGVFKVTIGGGGEEEAAG